jgi:Glycosyl transferase family 2
VSVVSTTYNQEAYVRDALDGFVAQKTDFPVEIIVADDASTDATPVIIQEYADRHPHLFRPIFRSENLGLHGNLTDALSAARGEYIALCEGDDFWIDPLKLAKQVALLDQHPETAVCFHPVRVTWTGGRARDSKFPPLYRRMFWRRFPPFYLRGNLSVDALIRRNFIQTNSVVYRRLPRYDDIPAVMPLDWYLHVRHAARGDIAMLPETMAVYRRHPQGMWYDADVDRAKFWLARGPGHAAMFDAMLDLFPGDPVREEIIAGMADWILRQIAKVPGPQGRAALLNSIAQHPRFAMVALQHRWAPTAGGRLKALWRKLTRYGAEVEGGCGRPLGERLNGLNGLTGKARSPVQSRPDAR